MNYKVLKIEDILVSVSETKKITSKKIIFLNTSDIEKGKIIKQDYMEVSKLPGQAKKSIKNGDILYSEIRPKNGRYCLVNGIDEDKYVVSTKLMVLRCISNTILNEYLYYYLTSKPIINYLQGIAESRSGTFPQITFSELSKLKIKVTDIKYQIKIVEFIKQLDSKIELNSQIISNLEELASTLFKRWFVDFEFPDKNGNPYKSSGGKMVDSELGEIPEGWEIIKLSDLVVQIKETFNPNKTEVEKVNHFSIPNFDSKKFPVIENVNTIKSNKTKITDFTVLFSKMNPNFERVWLTELNKSYLNVCSPEFIALDCKNINLQTYTYFLCKSTAFNRFLVNNATGSTGSRQRIKPSIAMGFKFVGAVDLINQYGEICSGISEQIMNLRNQIENLEEMRDALLPKLLSGEIELPEDEKV
ncbi:restriction endonuclease subunit S [Enterococcus faecalis]|uniref:restriction endonuclease subunit S n=1 Tax=Enterococcus faecalis TaxID=1351 RepID=UPI00232B369B|nr:restriction endonuclease subunit S [Enterococcus faecalis]MDB1590448.1 restriction endonuclease subunit S [Enterococcus faecalis]MDB1597428.1 restriction endonuclease subunit S [Enterococcus faecalis]MDB1605268.1 restriction endonuclease subunit S [Enterococcus faecalis]MDB1608515.1 restriction endonuclease subunit S [Enterococcus faecalis]MDB1610347.1 restriction endonuclease subunit S [Enterococcus faecalis]